MKILSKREQIEYYRELMVTRRGNRHDSMRGPYRPDAGADCRRVNLLYLHRFDSEAGSYDVNDRINSSDLVEMNLFRIGSVDAGLRLSKSFENADRVLFHTL